MAAAVRDMGQTVAMVTHDPGGLDVLQAIGTA